MELIATVILAMLLPTGLLIVGLAYLSVHLHLKTRALRTENSILQGENEELRQKLALPPLTPELHKALEELRHLPERQEEAPTERVPYRLLDPLSDASNPNWRKDIINMYCQVSGWDVSGRDGEDTYLFDGAESWAEDILKTLGYKGGVPTAVLLSLLRKNLSRSYAAYHIAISIALSQTSLDSEPEYSLLPFSPQVQRDLKTFYKAIEGIKFCPEFSTVLSKLPTQLASDHGEFNKENLVKTIDLLDKLFGHVGDLKYARAGLGRPFFQRSTTDHVQHGLMDAVVIQLRMLGSRQQFEFRWDETNESKICEQPAVYSHVDEDGVPLDEPKLWYPGDIVDVSEDGEYAKQMKQFRLEEIEVWKARQQRGLGHTVVMIDGTKQQ